MTKSSTGSFRQPHYLDGDAPDVAVNANEVADYAAEFGNYKVATNADRINATAWAWEGLEWRTTDTKLDWVFTGGAWKLAGPRYDLPSTSPLAGAAYTGGGQIVTKADSIVVTCDASSTAVAPWVGGAFTGGLISLVAMSGDAQTNTKQVIAAAPTLTQLKIQCLGGAGTGVGAVPVRINYIAVGWNV